MSALAKEAHITDEQLRPLLDLQSILKNVAAGSYVARLGNQWRRPGMRAEDFLDDLGLAAMVGGRIARRISKSLGANAQTTRTRDYPTAPFAYVVVALIASLPGRGIVATNVTSDRAGSCVVECVVPSSILAYEGIATFWIDKTGDDQVRVKAHLRTEGQYVDWGHGRRAFEAIFSSIDVHLVALKALKI